MRRRPAVLHLVWWLVAAMLMLTACGRATGGKGINELVVAQGVDAISLDPQRDVGIPTFNVNSNIYEALLTRERDLKIGGLLAEQYQAVSDTVWEFKLRQNVTFHNGEPLNADAVKFTIDRVLDPNQKSPQKGWFDTIARAEVVDANTVRIHTAKPDPLLPARMVLLLILPPKLTQDKGDAYLAANPVGTGPYKFVKWVKGDYIQLEANDKYWGGAPAIKTARIRAIPDTAARINALNAGEVHVITNLPPDQADPIEKGSKARVEAVPSSRVIFNALVTTKGGPLADVRVRQAINYGVNVQGIIDTVLRGRGTRVASPISNVIFGHDSGLQPYPYDPEKAKRLLAEAGYANGIDITLDSPSGRYLMDKDVAQAVAGDLAKIGVRVKVKVVEWGAYTQMFSTHKTDDMYLLGWSLPSLDPDNWLYPLLRSGEALSNYHNPEIDQLIDEARSTVNPEQREQQYHQLLGKIRDDAPWLFLYQQHDLYGVSKNLSWQGRADEALRLIDMKPAQ